MHSLWYMRPSTQSGGWVTRVMLHEVRCGTTGVMLKSFITATRACRTLELFFTAYPEQGVAQPFVSSHIFTRQDATTYVGFSCRSTRVSVAQLQQNASALEASSVGAGQRKRFEMDAFSEAVLRLFRLRPPEPRRPCCLLALMLCGASTQVAHQAEEAP